MQTVNDTLMALKRNTPFREKQVRWVFDGEGGGGVLS